MIDREYNSPVRQNRVKNYLTSLRVREFEENGMEVSVGLSKVYKLILKLSRQVSQSHRGDAHRIEFLRKAVLSYQWAHEPLLRVATHNVSFQQLYGELDASLQFDKEAKLELSRTSMRQSDSDSGVASNDYVGQGRYRNRNSNAVKPLESKNSGPLAISGCINCDDPTHMAKDCPNPRNLARAAAKKLECLQKKKIANSVHVVLAHLCNQFDSSMESSSDTEDKTLFEELLTTLDAHGIHENLEILSVNLAAGARGSNVFEGACVDSGAQQSVVGESQAELYCKSFGGEHNSTKSRSTYRFGNSIFQSLGMLHVRIPVAGSYFIDVYPEILEADVPFLLGLDILTQLKAHLDFDENKISSKYDGWTLPLTKKLGHVYIVWEPTILYTETELRKMHRHFHHPSAEKLVAVIKRASPENFSPSVLSDLEKIQDVCDVCQREADGPHRFRVSLPYENCIFNRVVLMDLMKLDGRSVLHVVDRDTKFGAACFLAGESSSVVWEAFLTVWVSPYVGYPECVSVDQGPQFQSDEWKNLLQAPGIRFHPSGVESHNALGVGERYHAFLRRIYGKIRTGNTTISSNQALSLAVKAINDTAGPNGLVSTPLVFGVMPRLPIRPHSLPDQVARLKAMKDAREEAARMVAQSRLATAIASSVPSAADSDIRIGDEVLFFREKPGAKWTGPFVVTNMDGKILTLDSCDRQWLASIDKVKLYQHRSQEVDCPSNEFGKSSDEQDYLRELDTIFGSPDTALNDPNSISVDEFVVKLVAPNDPRAMDDDFVEAKKREVSGLRKRNLWNIVKAHDVGKESNILGGRFILTLKNYGTTNEMANVRFVAQGFDDRDKPFIVHDTSTLRSISIRLILSTAAVHNFRILSHDVTQAYLQSKHKLSRKIYIRVEKQDLETFGLKEGDLLELNKPLYGLCDAGDYWGVTIDEHLINDLGMCPVPGDSSLYIKRSSDCLEGMTGTYVDDCLNAGMSEFEKLTEQTLAKFDSKPRVYDNFDFYGSQVTTIAKGKFLLSQKYYASNVSYVPKDCSFEKFRRHRALFSWLCHTRPDLACSASRASQVTDKSYLQEKVDELNRGIRKVKSELAAGLMYGSLEFESAHMRVYADALFATNDDLSSQLGYLILLSDRFNNAHVLDFCSKKAKRVVRSIMAGEVYVLVESFDAAFAIAKDLEVIYHKGIPIDMFTDSKQVFDAVTKGRKTAEKRLMIDILATREAYRRFEIRGIGLVFVRSESG